MKSYSHTLRYLFLFSFGFISAIKCTGQSVDSIAEKYASDYLPERIFIHYDRNLYFPGDTIWLKAYIMEANLPSGGSKNLYVDWMDDSMNMLKHDVYPISDNGSAGYFPIPSLWSGHGIHTVSYTNWMCNFDSSLFFQKSLSVMPARNSTHKEKRLTLSMHIPENIATATKRPSPVRILIKPAGNNILYSISKDNSTDTQQEGYRLMGTIYQQQVFAVPLQWDSTGLCSGTIPLNAIPAGILQLSVLDPTGSTVAIYGTPILHPQDIIEPQIALDTLSFGPQSKNVWTVTIPQDIAANVSIAVTDTFFDGIRDNNIANHLLYTSDIQAPYHKRFGTDMSANLETIRHLLATNEWRTYRWDYITSHNLPTLRYDRENRYLTLNGRIVPYKNRKIPQNSFLSLRVRSTGDSVPSDYSFRIDSILNFETNRLLFDSVDVFYHIAGKRVVPSDYAIRFLPDRLPPQQTNPFSRAPWDSREDDSLRREMTVRAFGKGDGDLLPEVTVKAKADNTLELLDKKYARQYKGMFGFSFDIRKSKDPLLRDYDVITFLMGKVPGLRISIGNVPSIMTTVNPLPPAVLWYSGRYPPVKFYIDEIPISEDDLLANPSYRFAYIKAIPPSSPFTGGKIIFYTGTGEDEFVSIPSAYSQTRILGYSPVRSFYPVDYSMKSSWKPVPDKRETLYWNPFILVPAHDRSFKIRFYNNTISKAYRLVIQGFNKQGQFIQLDKIIKQ